MKGPVYNLSEAKTLVSSKQHNPTVRVEAELANHGYNYDSIVLEVFEAIRPSDFYKSVLLKNLSPAVSADVYKVAYNGEQWYVKFFIDRNEKVHVEVWSLHWW